MFFRVLNEDGVEILYTLAAYTETNLSYNERTQYKEILQNILQEYSFHRSAHFLLAESNRTLIQSNLLSLLIVKHGCNTQALHIIHIGKTEPTRYSFDTSLQIVKEGDDMQSYQIQFHMKLYFHDPIDSQYEKNLFTNTVYHLLQQQDYIQIYTIRKMHNFVTKSTKTKKLKC